MIWNQSIPTIMVADNDDDERCLLKSILELKGFQVLEALDGEEAVELAVSKQPNLMLIQLKLPVISGFTAIRRMKRNDELKNIPIIAISLNTPSSNHNLALASGCDAHLKNPIEFDLLEGLIDRLLPGDRLPLASVLIQ